MRAGSPAFGGELVICGGMNARRMLIVELLWYLVCSVRQAVRVGKLLLMRLQDIGESVNIGLS